MVDMLTAHVLFFALLGQDGAVSSSDPAKAAVALQQAIRREPDKESNYTELGNLLLRTQNFPQAADVLEAARSRFPNSAQPVLSLGVAYYGLRRFPDAVEAFLAAGRLAPDAEQPIAFLSRLQEHWNDRKPEIESLLNAYSKAHPRDPLALYALGKLRADPALLRRSLALNPGFADAHFELASVLESQRDWPAAIASYQSAAHLSPKNPAPHYRLARLYARSGDKVKAEQERALHEKLAAAERAEVDRRQAATKHLAFGKEEK
jgi:tetratricopeptide (TPR) repeat protein